MTSKAPWKSGAFSAALRIEERWALAPVAPLGLKARVGGDETRPCKGRSSTALYAFRKSSNKRFNQI
jgi:hypothetical protein